MNPKIRTAGIISMSSLLLWARTSANALDFTYALKCNSSIGAKPGPWCLDHAFPSGRKVFFIKHKECHATTAEHHSVETEISQHEGTILADFSCASAKDSEDVVLDTEVKSYKILNLKIVIKENIPSALDKTLRNLPAFKSLLARGPDQSQMPPPVLELRLTEILRSKSSKTKTFVATYTEDGEIPFLISPKGITPLATPGEALTGVSAFNLNGVDFLRATTCQLGTDGCGEDYINLE